MIAPSSGPLFTRLLPPQEEVNEELLRKTGPDKEDQLRFNTVLDLKLQIKNKNGIPLYPSTLREQLLEIIKILGADFFKWELFGSFTRYLMHPKGSERANDVDFSFYCPKAELGKRQEYLKKFLIFQDKKILEHDPQFSKDPNSDRRAQNLFYVLFSKFWNGNGKGRYSNTRYMIFTINAYIISQKKDITFDICIAEIAQKAIFGMDLRFAIGQDFQLLELSGNVEQWQKKKLKLNPNYLLDEFSWVKLLLLSLKGYSCSLNDIEEFVKVVVDPSLHRSDPPKSILDLLKKGYDSLPRFSFVKTLFLFQASISLKRPLPDSDLLAIKNPLDWQEKLINWILKALYFPDTFDADIKKLSTLLIFKAAKESLKEIALIDEQVRIEFKRKDKRYFLFIPIYYNKELRELEELNEVLEITCTIKEWEDYLSFEDAKRAFKKNDIILSYNLLPQSYKSHNEGIEILFAAYKNNIIKKNEVIQAVPLDFTNYRLFVKDPIGSEFINKFTLEETLEYVYYHLGPTWEENLNLLKRFPHPEVKLLSIYIRAWKQRKLDITEVLSNLYMKNILTFQIEDWVLAYPKKFTSFIEKVCLKDNFESSFPLAVKWLSFVPDSLLKMDIEARGGKGLKSFFEIKEFLSQTTYPIPLSVLKLIVKRITSTRLSNGRDDIPIFFENIQNAFDAWIKRKNLNPINMIPCYQDKLNYFDIFLYMPQENEKEKYTQFYTLVLSELIDADFEAVISDYIVNQFLVCYKAFPECPDWLIGLTEKWVNKDIPSKAFTPHYLMALPILLSEIWRSVPSKFSENTSLLFKMGLLTGFQNQNVKYPVLRKNSYVMELFDRFLTKNTPESIDHIFFMIANSSTELHSLIPDEFVDNLLKKWQDILMQKTEDSTSLDSAFIAFLGKYGCFKNKPQTILWVDKSLNILKTVYLENKNISYCFKTLILTHYVAFIAKAISNHIYTSSNPRLIESLKELVKLYHLDIMNNLNELTPAALDILKKLTKYFPDLNSEIDLMERSINKPKICTLL